MALNERWHAYTGQELANAVCSVGESLRDDQERRISRARISTGIFENHRFGEMDESYYYHSDGFGEEAYGYNTMRWNLSRSVCQSVQAEIAGLNRPKPQFVTTGADWHMKRRSKKLDRFVEGQLFMPQSGYQTAWHLAVQCFLDGEVWGTGVAKVSADQDDGRVCIERVFQHELYVDLRESSHGCPQNLFHIYAADVDTLIARYPEKKEELLRAEPPKDSTGGRGVGGGKGADDRVVKTVLVYEAWRLPLNKKTPGKWVRAVSGGVLLEEHPYDRAEFPFAFTRWTKHLLGFWGTSLVEETEHINHWVNYQLERFYEAEKLTPKAVCLYPIGSLEDTSHILSNEDAICIPYNGSLGAPQWVSPASYSQASLDLLTMNWEKGFELPGVSQMNATARKESGVTSGVAIRTVRDMQTRRFSVAEEDYEQFIITLSRLIVGAAEDLAEEDKNFASAWPNGDFVTEIKFGDARLDDEIYLVQTYPVSGTKNTPADRLQLAAELNAEGKLSDDGYLRVVQYMDTMSELSRSEKQTATIERYIEGWLDATPKTIANGEYRYRGPNKFLPRPEDALLQVMDAYMEAELDEAPDANLELFRRFLGDLDKIIVDRQQRAAALAAGQAPSQQGAMAAPSVN